MISQLEPVGNKTFTQDFTAGIDLKCPSEVTSLILYITIYYNHSSVFVFMLYFLSLSGQPILQDCYQQ